MKSNLDFMALSPSARWLFITMFTTASDQVEEALAQLATADGRREPPSVTVMVEGQVVEDLAPLLECLAKRFDYATEDRALEIFNDKYHEMYETVERKMFEIDAMMTDLLNKLGKEIDE